MFNKSRYEKFKYVSLCSGMLLLAALHHQNGVSNLLLIIMYCVDVCIDACVRPSSL